MALITCAECGTHASTSAKTCPQCGANHKAMTKKPSEPMSKTSKIMIAVIIGLLVAVVTITQRGRPVAGRCTPGG